LQNNLLTHQNKELYYHFVSYEIKGNEEYEIKEEKVIPYYFLNIDILQFGSLGKGQLQIKKLNNLDEITNTNQSKKEFENWLDNAYLEYQIKEKEKLEKRIQKQKAKIERKYGKTQNTKKD